MRSVINTFNEKLEKQNQSKNIKIKKVELPSINTKENQLNILQYKNSIRNPHSANLSNKVLNNAIEIGKKIYNRDIITPNIVNMYTILEKENKDFINNNNNVNFKSSPKNRISFNLKKNNQEKNKFNFDIKRSSLDNKQNIIGTEKNKRNNDIQMLNNDIPVKIKEQFSNINNINNINKYLNSNKKNVFIKVNDNNNLKNNPMNIFSKINNNKSSNLLKKINIPFLLNEKNNYIYLSNLNNNINIFQSIDRKEVSKETGYYNKIINNNRVRKINKSKNNSKIKLLDKKYCFININKSNSYEKSNKNSNITNVKNNKEDLCFISYSYNEHANIPYRKSMEDYHCIKQNLLKNNSNIFSYFGIFDGHSGDEVALFLSKNLHKILSKQLNNLCNQDSNNNIDNRNSKIISYIKNSFEIADNEIIKSNNYNKDVGSTATIILLYKIKNNNVNNGNLNKNDFSKYIICANVGDSKGYILTRNNFFQITKDHKCTDMNEVERIKKNGGIVFSNRVFGTLMLTRSFGDKEMKKYGVISSPDCYCHKIKDEDLYIIIASDGIWDAVSEEEIMQMGGDKLSSDDFSKKIVKLAIDKGTRDNISCIVIKLNKDI